MIGCGERGLNVYGEYAKDNPNNLKFVSCAEPNLKRREMFAKIHNISDDMTFITDDDALKAGKIADIAFICTMDMLHEKAVISALDLGYHVFLEKPMAISEQGCRKIVAKSEEVGKILAVGHVLRYSPLFSKVKEIVDSGVLGDIVNIKHSENMGTWVYAHSFVRGNWENSKETSSLILQKGVHDLDLIYWFANNNPSEIVCLETPTPFNPSNAPKNAPTRCIEGCPYSETCLYETARTYLQGRFVQQDLSRSESRAIKFLFKLVLKHPKLARSLFPPLKKEQVVPWRRWPTSQLTDDLSDEGLVKALREGKFGRCIYHCNNDQPVSQFVGIKFENGLTATYNLHGMSYRDGRETRIDGTKGSLKSYFYNSAFYIDVFDHLNASTEKVRLKIERSAGGGGDYRIMDEFIDALNGVKPPPISSKESLVSHLMAFAAERSVKNKSVEIIQY